MGADNQPTSNLPLDDFERLSKEVGYKPPSGLGIVFWWNLYAKQIYGEYTKLAINQGGSGSGKTYSLIQVAVWICASGYEMSSKPIQEWESGKALTFTVAANELTAMKRDAMRYVPEVINSNPFLQSQFVKYNGQTLTYHFANGSQLEFVDAADPEKSKKGKRHYLYCCEITGIPQQSFEELYMRTSIFAFVDYNPSKKFFIHTVYKPQCNSPVFDELSQSERTAVVAAWEATRGVQKANSKIWTGALKLPPTVEKRIIEFATLNNNGAAPFAMKGLGSQVTNNDVAVTLRTILPSACFIRSTYKNNPFVPESTYMEFESLRAELLAYESRQLQLPIEQREEHPKLNRFRVYGQGKDGKVEGLVFQNVSTCKIFPDDVEEVRIGIDFGYTNDPTAIVKIAKKGGNLYGELLCYQTGLDGIAIGKIILDLQQRGKIPNSKSKIRVSYYYDSAEQVAPVQIKRVARIILIPAQKGAGSIVNGIEYLKGFENIFITADSTEWLHEAETYSYPKANSNTADPNKPIDANNHAWDAARYACGDWLIRAVNR